MAWPENAPFAYSSARGIRETAEQKRLGQILERHEESTSTLKDLVTQIMGNTAAVVHASAGDEILKNSFATRRLKGQSLPESADHQLPGPGLWWSESGIREPG